MTPRPSLQVTVTTLLFGLGLSLIGVNYASEIRGSRSAIRTVVLDRATAMGNRLAGKLEFLAARGDSALTELEIAGLGGTPDIRIALVADATDTIRLATNPDLVGSALGQLVGAEFLRGTPFRQSVLGRSLFTDSTITAIYPYRTPPLPGELRSMRTGVLLLSYDLSTPMIRARRQALRESLVQGLLVVGLCLVVWLALHRSVTLPLKRLADGTRRIEAGEGARVPVEPGPPEIEHVTERFNHMAEQVMLRQRALARANRALRALSDCRKEVSASQYESTLLERVCRLVVEVAGYRFAWVGYVAPNGDRQVAPVAHAGYEAGYLGAVRVTWDDSELGHGPTGRAIRTGRPTVCQDIQTDPQVDPWREAQIARGYGASAVFPLLNGEGAVFGALSVYAAERGVLDDEEVRLLNEIAEELAGGVMRLRARKHQEEVEQSLATNAAMLRQAQKMEAIGQLAGGVAHDFNNILGAIMMQAALANDEADVSPAQREALEEIRHAAERGANLTRQLLVFSRKQVMQLRVLDLNQTVTSLARMLQRVLREDVRMELRLNPGSLCAEADAGMIDQVLMNLAVNARDAMPTGGRLIIETTMAEVLPGEVTMPELAAGRYACIRVSDTGTGIPPEVLPHIFEPFYTTKAVGQGTGLGLATVFGIVQQHHGGMRVETRAGKGTTFEVLLPLAREPEWRGETRTAARLQRNCSETILVVEDDTVVRSLVQQALERAGYTVLAAADGVQAMELWKRTGPIHLLFTDIVLPEGKSGPELAAALTRRDPALRVIYTSGYIADLRAGNLRLLEGVNYLQKPVALDQLLETVGAMLDRPIVITR